MKNFPKFLSSGVHNTLSPSHFTLKGVKLDRSGTKRVRKRTKEKIFIFFSHFIKMRVKFLLGCWCCCYCYHGRRVAIHIQLQKNSRVDDDALLFVPHYKTFPFRSFFMQATYKYIIITKIHHKSGTPINNTFSLYFVGKVGCLYTNFFQQITLLLIWRHTVSAYFLQLSLRRLNKLKKKKKLNKTLT